MDLTPGTKLGPYELLAPLGEGGMGEVWKARDTRLGRTVALKVSKSAFTERFEREARAVAALNHPNICTLHDVGPDYFVMELVDGAPLKGPLPVAKALDYAGQILDALDAAHRKGITHRDLKPANILVTKQGIKLLDFGLAQQSAPLRETDVTATAQLTGAGQILGTLQYMSPEQLQGKTADARGDLFAFGCVFYEMLSGEQAFTGESPASVIAAILEREPIRIEATTPFERVIKRCLAKDPDDRWQSARDLKIALQWAAERSAAAPARSSKWRDWAGLAAGVCALAMAIAWMARPRGSVSIGEVVRFTVTPPEKGNFTSPTNTTVAVPQFALSPDGTAIVFAANLAGDKPMLWLRRLTDAAARPLAGSENAALPFWSPDSQWLGFFADGQLKKLPALGGAVQVLAGEIADIFGGSWAPDDTILFGSGHGGISKVAAAGGPVTRVTSFNASREDTAHRWPHVLPDGRHFLYFARSKPEHRGIYVRPLDGGVEKLLLRTEADGVFAPPGYLLYVEGDTLFGQPFDTNRLELKGNRFAIANQAGRSTNAHGAVSVSTTGVLAHAGVMLEAGQLKWFDRSGAELGTVGSPVGHYSDFRLSPDGQRLAMSMFDPKNTSLNIWLADLVRGSASLFAFGNGGVNTSAVWSPDGSRLIFRLSKNGNAVELHQQHTGGGGNPELLLALDQGRAAGMRSIARVPSDWSPDGRSILISAPSPDTGFDIWRLPLEGERKPVSFLASRADEMHANFSPDGKFVAYTSNESGRFEVYVQTFPLSERKWQISTVGGAEPRWRRDGREIYYLSPDRKLMAASVTRGPAFGIPQALFQTQATGQTSAYRTHYVPANDGQRFLVNAQSGDAPTTAINVVLNWTAGLKK